MNMKINPLPNQTSFLKDDIKAPTFVQELESLLNRHSIENESDTPDWILMDYIRRSLDAWNNAVLLRDRWYGHKTLTRG